MDPKNNQTDQLIEQLEQLSNKLFGLRLDHYRTQDAIEALGEEIKQLVKTEHYLASLINQAERDAASRAKQTGSKNFDKQEITKRYKEIKDYSNDGDAVESLVAKVEGLKPKAKSYYERMLDIDGRIDDLDQKLKTTIEATEQKRFKQDKQKLLDDLYRNRFQFNLIYDEFLRIVSSIHLELELSQSASSRVEDILSYQAQLDADQKAAAEIRELDEIQKRIKEKKTALEDLKARRTPELQELKQRQEAVLAEINTVTQNGATSLSTGQVTDLENLRARSRAYQNTISEINDEILPFELALSEDIAKAAKKINDLDRQNVKVVKRRLAGDNPIVTTEQIPPLRTTQERLDRIKGLLILKDNLVEGRDTIDQHVLDHFPRTDRRVKLTQENFYAEFEKLTGVNLIELKARMARQGTDRRARERVFRNMLRPFINDLSRDEYAGLMEQLVGSEDKYEKAGVAELEAGKEEEYEDLPKHKRVLKRLDEMTDPSGDRDPFVRAHHHKRTMAIQNAVIKNMQNYNFIGLVADLSRVPSLRGGGPSYSAEFKKFLRNKVGGYVKETKAYKKAAYHAYKIKSVARRGVDKYRKAKRKVIELPGKLFAFVLGKAIAGIIKGADAVIDTAKDVANKAHNAIRASSTFGGIYSRGVNLTTRVFEEIKDMNIPDKAKSAASYIQRQGQTLVRYGKGAVSVAKRWYQAAATTAQVGQVAIQALARGALIGGGLFLVTGSAPLAIGVGAAATAIEVGHRIMQTPNFLYLRYDFEPITPIGKLAKRGINFLQEQGGASFRNGNGDLKAMAGTAKTLPGGTLTERQLELLQKYGNIYGSGWARLFKAMRGGGMIGGLTAVAIARLLGLPINPFLSFIGGFTVGTAGQYLIDRFVGSLQASAVLGTAHPVIQFLSRIPAMQILQQSQVNPAIAKFGENIRNEFEEAKNGGRFDVAALNDHLSFSSAGGLLGKISALLNYASIAYFPFNQASLVNRIFTPGIDAILQRTGSKVLLKDLAKEGLSTAASKGADAGIGLLNKIKTSFFNPATAGAIVGTVVGLAIAGFLGFTGVAAMTGATIGGLVGTGVGILISGGLTGISGGLLSWATFGIVSVSTTIGTVAGAWIGNIFDKTIGNMANGLMTLISGIGALLQMINFLVNLEFDLKKLIQNVVPLAMSLMAMMPLMDTAMNNGVANNCTVDDTDSRCNKSVTVDEAQNAYLRNNQVNLAYYNIKFINKSNTPISYANTQKLILALKDVSLNLPKAENESLFIINRPGEFSVYSNIDKGLIIALDLNNYEDSTTLAQDLRGILNTEDLALE